jgi:hypothetical protein
MNSRLRNISGIQAWPSGPRKSAGHLASQGSNAGRIPANDMSIHTMTTPNVSCFSSCNSGTGPQGRCDQTRRLHDQALSHCCRQGASQDRFLSKSILPRPLLRTLMITRLPHMLSRGRRSTQPRLFCSRSSPGAVPMRPKHLATSSRAAGRPHRCPRRYVYFKPSSSKDIAQLVHNAQLLDIGHHSSVLDTTRTPMLASDALPGEEPVQIAHLLLTILDSMSCASHTSSRLRPGASAQP